MLQEISYWAEGLLPQCWLVGFHYTLVEQSDSSSVQNM